MTGQSCPIIARERGKHILAARSWSGGGLETAQVLLQNLVHLMQIVRSTLEVVMGGLQIGTIGLERLVRARVVGRDEAGNQGLRGLGLVGRVLQLGGVVLV